MPKTYKDQHDNYTEQNSMAIPSTIHVGHERPSHKAKNHNPTIPNKTKTHSKSKRFTSFTDKKDRNPILDDDKKDSKLKQKRHHIHQSSTKRTPEVVAIATPSPPIRSRKIYKDQANTKKTSHTSHVARQRSPIEPSICAESNYCNNMSMSQLTSTIAPLPTKAATATVTAKEKLESTMKSKSSQHNIPPPPPSIVPSLPPSSHYMDSPSAFLTANTVKRVATAKSPIEPDILPIIKAPITDEDYYPSEISSKARHDSTHHQKQNRKNESHLSDSDYHHNRNVSLARNDELDLDHDDEAYMILVSNALDYLSSQDFNHPNMTNSELKEQLVPQTIRRKLIHAINHRMVLLPTKPDKKETRVGSITRKCYSVGLGSYDPLINPILHVDTEQKSKEHDFDASNDHVPIDDTIDNIQNEKKDDNYNERKMDFYLDDDKWNTEKVRSSSTTTSNVTQKPPPKSHSKQNITSASKKQILISNASNDFSTHHPSSSLPHHHDLRQQDQLQPSLPKQFNTRSSQMGQQMNVQTRIKEPRMKSREASRRVDNSNTEQAASFWRQDVNLQEFAQGDVRPPMKFDHHDRRRPQIHQSQLNQLAPKDDNDDHNNYYLADDLDGDDDVDDNVKKNISPSYDNTQMMEENMNDMNDDLSRAKGNSLIQSRLYHTSRYKKNQFNQKTRISNKNNENHDTSSFDYVNFKDEDDDDDYDDIVRKLKEKAMKRSRGRTHHQIDANDSLNSATISEKSFHATTTTTLTNDNWNEFTKAYQQQIRQNLPTINVVSPANLPGGYSFEANLGKARFLALVPDGGVKKGEVFSTPMVTLDKVQISVTIGQWRDNIFDCLVHGMCHPLLLCATFFPQIGLGQIMTRNQLDWLGNVGTKRDTANTCRTTTIIYLFWMILNIYGGYAIAYDWFTGNPPNINDLVTVVTLNGILSCYMICAVSTARSNIRAKYAIDEKDCIGCEDCCCAICCTCCVIAQMGRHTGNFETFRPECCSSTGLPSHVNVNPGPMGVIAMNV